MSSKDDIQGLRKEMREGFSGLHVRIDQLVEAVSKTTTANAVVKERLNSHAAAIKAIIGTVLAVLSGIAVAFFG